MSSMKITLSLAKVSGQPSNRFYPQAVSVTDAVQMAGAMAFDHVCGRFKNNRRSRENFISSDCIVMDCDNSHSDDPSAWIRPEDHETVFPDISCVIVPSRNHMKAKSGKATRPRFHVYFPISEMTDEAEYAALKRGIQHAFPFFDTNALDSARFIFGNGSLDPDQVIWQEGDCSVQEYLFFNEGTDPEDIIPEGSRNSALSIFAARILKRYGNSPEAHEAFREEADKCDPPLEKDELRTIWRSALRFYRSVKASPDYVNPEEYNGPEWSEPIPFEKAETEAFPLDALPPVLSEYVSAVAESTQTPVDMAGTVAISILSTCLQGKYRVQGKPDWIEPLNTYALVIAAPSERKSAVTHMMVKPLNDYEIQFNRDHAAEVETSRMEKRILARKQKAIEDQISKGKATQEDMERIAKEIADFEELMPLQLYVDDITPEKLVSVISANHGRAAMISTEGGIFDTLAGAYSKIVNIDVMLKGYSGDTIRVDRIGRDSEYVTSPALTILLMAQPSVVSEVLSNGTFRGRGLTARFLYCIPQSQVGSRKYHSESVPDDTTRAYETKIRRLLEDESKDELITLSPEADRLIASYAEELEPLLVTRYADLSDWCGKLIGNTLRIAGLLCRAEADRCFDFGALEDSSTVNEPLMVDGIIMENAIRLSRYYLSHARAAYSVLPDNAMSFQAEKLLSVMREKELKAFDRREMMRMCRSFKRVDDIQPVLDCLEDYGYIERMPEAPSKTGRPPLPKYAVNPSVYIAARIKTES